MRFSRDDHNTIDPALKILNLLRLKVNSSFGLNMTVLYRGIYPPTVRLHTNNTHFEKLGEKVQVQLCGTVVLWRTFKTVTRPVLPGEQNWSERFGKICWG